MKHYRPNMNILYKRLNKTLNVVVKEAVEAKKPIVHENGIIGNHWEVKKLGKNDYQIILKGTEKIIVDNIELYQVAFNVAYLLNKGHEIDSINIKEILDEHNEVANNFHEALFYKKKREVYAKQSDWFKFDLMDSKYHRAKELAYLHKNKLRKSFPNR